MLQLLGMHFNYADPRALGCSLIQSKIYIGVDRSWKVILKKEVMVFHFFIVCSSQRMADQKKDSSRAAPPQKTPMGQVCEIYMNKIIGINNNFFEKKRKCGCYILVCVFFCFLFCFVTTQPKKPTIYVNWIGFFCDCVCQCIYIYIYIYI